MPWNTRLTSAPMRSHPCPQCHRTTIPDGHTGAGHCHTWNCPNKIPDDLIRPAREAALAHWRDLRAATKKNG